MRKEPSIETEIEDGEDAGEDVTGPNPIKIFLHVVIVSRAASDNTPARTSCRPVIWPCRGPREATSQVLADIVATLKQQFSEKYVLGITKQIKILVRNDTR